MFASSCSLVILAFLSIGIVNRPGRRETGLPF
jgi:hypothetical protein